jgi:hypothetical protein
LPLVCILQLHSTTRVTPIFVSHILQVIRCN